MRVISRLKHIALPLCAAALAAWSVPALGTQPCSVTATVNVVAQTVSARGAGTGPEKTTVTLNGSPSTKTNDADPVTYTWQQVANDSGDLLSVGTLTPNAKRDQVTFTAPEVGPGGATLKFSLTVTGAGCSPTAISTTYAYVTVTDVSTNHAPTAALTVLPGTTIGENVASFTLDGSNSSDSDGDALTYLFEQVFTDNSTLTLCGGASSAKTCEVTTPDVGTAGASLRYRLTVWDTSKVQSVLPAEQIVSVTFVNQPPVAVATCSPGIPVTVPEGGKVTLDGSASTDGDGDGIASREWTQKSGGPDAKLAETHVVDGPGVWSFTAPALKANFGDTMVFELVVTDNGATGAAPMSAKATCSVQVRDVTPPEIDPATVPSNQTLEATSKDGAVVTFELPTATDNYSQVTVSCSPASRSTFALGTTTVTCTATDEALNSSTATFSIDVVDRTPPDFTPPANVTAEATSKDGAIVSFTVPAATDIVDEHPTVTCDPASGSQFALGSTTVTCTATDFSHNSASKDFTVTVRDTTPPALTVPSGVTEEAENATGAVATFSTSATDAVDPDPVITCTPSSGSRFALGPTTVSCIAKDATGNTTNPAKTFVVTVQDTTPPTVTVPSNIHIGPTQWNGGYVASYASYGPISAKDKVDGSVAVTCDPLDGPATIFFFGTPRTVTCSATDSHHNTGQGSFTVTVDPFTFLGFFAPIDNMPLINTVKNGSTVPVKWKLQGQDSIDITDTLAVTGLSPVRVSCDAFSAALEAPVEFTATSTGGSVLRYDLTAKQFVFNWQTPKIAASCWRLDIGFADKSFKSAFFKLK